LLPVLRSETQAWVLAALLLQPGREVGLTDLALELDADPASVQREAERLVRSDILADRRVGRTRLLRAGESKLVRPLADLLLVAYGRVPCWRTRSPVSGVQDAYVFGSWASRYLGQPGHDPADVDVLVVGRPDRDDLDARVQGVARRLGRDVAAVVRTPEAWQAADTGFLRTVRSRPLVRLELTADADLLQSDRSAGVADWPCRDPRHG